MTISVFAGLQCPCPTAFWWLRKSSKLVERVLPNDGQTILGQRPINVSTLSEARFHKGVKSGRGALRVFDRAV